MEKTTQATSGDRNFIAIQQAMSVPLDKNNTFGNFNYRTLDDILVRLKPLLNEYQAYVKLDTVVIFHDNAAYQQATAKYHDDDFEITAVYEVREDAAKKKMDAPQVSGSAASYAKKGALANLFLIDDGSSDPDSTSGKPVKPTQPSNNQAKNAKPLPKPKPKLKKYTPAEMLRAQVTYGGKKTNIWNVYTKAFKEKDVTAQTWWKENHNDPDSALGNLIRQYGPFMKEKEAEKAKEAQQSK